jgi:transposase
MRGRIFTDEQLVEAVKLSRNGVTTKDIAERFDVRQSSVKALFGKLRRKGVAIPKEATGVPGYDWELLKVKLS